MLQISRILHESKKISWKLMLDGLGKVDWLMGSDMI